MCLKNHSYFNGRFTEVTTAEEHFDSTLYLKDDAAGNELRTVPRLPSKAH